MDPNYSVELCGGTHVGSTGELGLLKIIGESAVAAGVRRIEAISGQRAEKFMDQQLLTIKAIREILKQPKDLSKAVEDLVSENHELKKKLEKVELKELDLLKIELVKSVEQVNGASFIGKLVEVTSADALKKLCYEIRNELDNCLAVLCTNISGKPYVAIGIADKLLTTKTLDAGKIIKEVVAPLIKGGGGGQKSLATGGGQDPTNLVSVINAVKNLL
jgi:alanyl-tRNA synthetase